MTSLQWFSMNQMISFTLWEVSPWEWTEGRLYFLRVDQSSALDLTGKGDENTLGSSRGYHGDMVGES